MKIYPIVIVIFASLLIIPSLSMGISENTDNGDQLIPIDTPHRSPIILSTLPGAGLKFWIQPDQTGSILYDQWNILIFGDPGDSCKLKINGIEAFNGSLVRNYLNISFDASELTTATVIIQISNRSYSFHSITIIHWDIGIGSGGGSSDKHGSYFQADINKARFMASIGATILSLISIYITWSLLKFVNSRKGVERI